MKAPGTAFDDPVLGRDEQPATMAGYVHTTMDNGGVHTNSGIPNHAFYVAAMAFGGYAWEKAGRIWYETLRDRRLEADVDVPAVRRADRAGCCAALRDLRVEDRRRGLEGSRHRRRSVTPSPCGRSTAPTAEGETVAMRIDFRIDGGLAAFPGLAKPVSIDCAALPANDAARLGELRPQGGFLRGAAVARRAPMPDARAYTIAIDDGLQCRTLTFAEPIADASMRELVAELRLRAGAIRRGGGTR